MKFVNVELFDVELYISKLCKTEAEIFDQILSKIISECRHCSTLPLYLQKIFSTFPQQLCTTTLVLFKPNNRVFIITESPTRG